MDFVSDAYFLEESNGNTISIRLTASPSISDFNLNTLHQNSSIPIGGTYIYDVVDIISDETGFQYENNITISGLTSGAKGLIILDNENFVKILNGTHFNGSELVTTTPNDRQYQVSSVITFGFSTDLASVDYNIFDSFSQIFTIDNGTTSDAEIFIADAEAEITNLLRFLRGNTNTQEKEI